MQTLGDIVSSVLEGADTSIKIASDADTEPAGEVDNFDEILGITDSGDADTSSSEPEVTEEPKTASADDVLADAQFAMKLAAALDRCSEVVSAKLASGTVMDTPGPQVLQAEHQVASEHPTAQTNSVPGPQKSHGGGTTEKTMNAPNGIETNKKDFSSPDWTKNKEAALELIETKTAQAEQYMQAGDIDQASSLLDEVEAMHAKIAEHPGESAKLPKGSNTGKLDTEPGPASHVPDNAGMASMTRGSAKDSSTREATKFFSEKPKQDNAVSAHIGKTDGLKISSLVEAVDKHSKTAADACPPKKDEKDKEAADTTPVAAEPLRGEKLAAARAFLQKQASKATDPNATEAEKKAAAEIINTVKAKLGDEQTEALLS